MWKQVDSLTLEVTILFLQLCAKFHEDVELGHETNSEDGIHP